MSPVLSVAVQHITICHLACCKNSQMVSLRHAGVHCSLSAELNWRKSLWRAPGASLLLLSEPPCSLSSSCPVQSPLQSPLGLGVSAASSFQPRWPPHQGLQTPHTLILVPHLCVSFLLTVFTCTCLPFIFSCMDFCREPPPEPENCEMKLSVYRLPPSPLAICAFLYRLHDCLALFILFK